ncbi:zinc finger MYND domain-containing protein 12 isoform X2 [Microcaecilia unicolor]|uniref:Zinc finger MYND domain-containing protein 12 isoform X2 n=1 Tax=Microcaecilia unicolor TaxID=1415580 RepID=A0A6P7ZGJ4_9AMPH|nr:zinc finger MYND domain-containing protein 12 isoform X2 [Microcaecilia unicolor]
MGEAAVRAVREHGPPTVPQVQGYLLLKHLIDITYQESQKFLSEGNHENALPAALHSLRFNIEVYGLKSLELVPTYLILSEANIGLGDLAQAQEYLAQAQWTVLKSPECGSDVHHRLHRSLGRLYAAEGNFQESLYHLANDVYHASEAFGTDDIRVTGGYFQMANVFFHQNKRDIADSLYTEVTNIWHNHLSKLARMQLQPDKESSQTPVVPENAVEGTFDEVQKLEGLQILNAILDFREQSSKQDLVKVMKVLDTLTLFHFMCMNFKKAHELGKRVLWINEHFPDQAVPEILPILLEWIEVKLLSSK